MASEVAEAWDNNGKLTEEALVPDGWKRVWALVMKVIDGFQETEEGVQKFVVGYLMAIKEAIDWDWRCSEWIMNKVFQTPTVADSNVLRTELLLCLPKNAVASYLDVSRLYTVDKVLGWIDYVNQRVNYEKYEANLGFFYMMVKCPMGKWSTLFQNQINSRVENTKDGDKAEDWNKAYNVARQCRTNGKNATRVQFKLLAEEDNGYPRHGLAETKGQELAGMVLVLLEDFKGCYVLVASLLGNVGKVFETQEAKHYTETTHSIGVILSLYHQWHVNRTLRTPIGKLIEEKCFGGDAEFHIRVAFCEEMKMMEWNARLHAFISSYQSPVINGKNKGCVISPGGKFYFPEERDLDLAASVVFPLVWAQVHGQPEGNDVREKVSYESILLTMSTAACYKYAMGDVKVVPKYDFKYDNWSSETQTDDKRKTQKDRFDAMKAYLHFHHSDPFMEKQKFAVANIGNGSFGSAVADLRKQARWGVYTEKGLEQVNLGATESNVVLECGMLLPHYMALYTQIGYSERNKCGIMEKGKQPLRRHVKAGEYDSITFRQVSEREENYPEEWKEKFQDRTLPAAVRDYQTILDGNVRGFNLGVELFMANPPAVLLQPNKGGSGVFSFISPTKRTHNEAFLDRTGIQKALNF